MRRVIVEWETWRLRRARATVLRRERRRMRVRNVAAQSLTTREY